MPEFSASGSLEGQRAHPTPVEDKRFIGLIGFIGFIGFTGFIGFIGFIGFRIKGL